MNTDEHRSSLVQPTLHAGNPSLVGVLLNKTLLAFEGSESSLGRGGDPCSSVFIRGLLGLSVR
jgi:hypothetical protein